MADAVGIDAVRKLKEPNPNRLTNNIGRILNNVATFAVDSAVNDSRKGVPNLKTLYRIVQERLKDLPTSLSLDAQKKPEDSKLLDKMQREMEEISSLKEQRQTSAKCLGENLPMKELPNEGTRGSDTSETKKKRIFIRSRL